jgi:phosphoglucomutase/phosphomannomutase
MSSLDQVRNGFAALTIDADRKNAAIASIALWMDDPRFTEYRGEIDHLVATGQWDLLLFNFFQTLPFGTGGRRGPVGVGPNAYNPFTLATSVQGHVDYMRDKFGDRALTVVVVFDVRVFQDTRGLYSQREDNPLQGLSSRDFARIAAEVYAANGIRVLMADPAGDWIVSTPEMSHAIQATGADGGLNISASHNHPDDNGGKFYDELGGQEVPPNDERFSRFVEDVEQAPRIDFEGAVNDGRVVLLDPATIHDSYMHHILSLSLRPAARSAKIVMTNLHGAGDTNAGDVLERAGFDVHYVQSQRAHDGAFTNVPFRIANPEVPETMAEGTRLARELEADIVLATDPDADRIGLVTRKGNGDYVFVNGNEIGALVTDQMFSRKESDGTLPNTPLFVTTEVTSRLPGALAAHHGGSGVTDLLVGCKYIANVMEHVQQTGTFGAFAGQRDSYVLGLEESHGVMVSPALRDKDAAGAALMLAERASEERDAGRTLHDALRDCWKKVGVHITRQVSIVIEGAIGMEQIAAMQTGLRALQVGELLGERRILRRDDFLNEACHGPFISETDRKARDFLSFTVEGEHRVLMRPSGTEPKIKLYTEGIGLPIGLDASEEVLDEEHARIEAIVSELSDQVAIQAHAILGISMPRHGLRVSALLGLSARRDFVDHFLPELLVKTQESSGDLGPWIDQRIDDYGRDARALVKGGVALWLESAALDGAQKGRIRDAFEGSDQV